MANPAPEKDLKERPRKFAVRIVKMYAALPKAIEAQVIGRQILRSGTSVGAQYHEGLAADPARNRLVNWKVRYRSWKKPSIG